MAVAIVLATAAVARVAVGYDPFPAADVSGEIALGLSRLDPGLFARDDLLGGLGSPVSLLAPLLWLLEGIGRVAEGWFALTLVLTVGTVFLLRRLLRALGGDDLFLPVVLALGVTVSVRGLGSGAVEGVMGRAFDLTWLASTLVLGAYASFVRGRPVLSGAWLGAAAWAHPPLALHGALALGVAGLVDRGKGVAIAAVATGVAGVVSVPAVLPWISVIGGGSAALPLDSASLVRDTVLFRMPHHFRADLLPLLVVMLLGGLALTARRRIASRDPAASTRFYGLLAGEACVLAVALALYGVVAGPWTGPFWLYSLDLLRGSPLLLALGAVAVAAGFRRADEPVEGAAPRRLTDTILVGSAVLSGSYLLLVNLEHGPWVYVLGLATLAAWVGTRRGVSRHGMAAGFLVLSVAAGWAALRSPDLTVEPEPAEAALQRWARTETPENALFIVPPGLEGFRLAAERSVFVDFRTFPIRSPTLAGEWRRRLELVTDRDATALEQARGWDAAYWLDRAYAKRNPASRCSWLLSSTGADYFVEDRLYGRLPPHLPVEPESLVGSGLEVIFENARYRVYRPRAAP